MKKLIFTVCAVISIALSSVAYAQTTPVPAQIGDQVIVNSSFDSATPTVTATGAILYFKPDNWSCPTYKNSPYGSWCGYWAPTNTTSGSISITGYRTSNRLQPSGYWYQAVYLTAGTYHVEGNFAADKPNASQGIVVTVTKGGPTATGTPVVKYMSNQPAGVYTSTYRVDVSGVYYITVGHTGTLVMQTYGPSTVHVQDLTFTYTGL